MQSSSFPGAGVLSGQTLRSYICDEHAWRLPAEVGAAEGGPRLALSRWIRTGAGSTEMSATTPEGIYTVGVSLRSTDITFLHDGRLSFEGRAMPGMFQVTAPGHSARAVFHSACDILHLTFRSRCSTRVTAKCPAATAAQA